MTTSKFYLTDPKILTAALSDQEFRIYHYLCSNYNITKRSAFIRIVDIAGLFQLTKKEVQEILINLSKIKLDDHPLISIKQDKYISFDMPSHKNFIETIGFKKFSNKGFATLNNHFQEIHRKELNKEYLYPGLDRWELQDQLEDLPTEELNKIKSSQLLYPWVLRDVIKNRA